MEITKWEYANSSTGVAGDLNKLGKDGWEVVGGGDGALILKRPCGKIQVREVPHKEEK
jgi:hypothetical protein